MAAGTFARAMRKPTPGFARWTITLLVFLAFAFQSYVTQTHIHFPHEAAVNIFASADKSPSHAKSDTSGKQSPDKYPPNDDPANCPICQEVAHAGQFVMPDYVAVLLPSQPVSIVPVVIVLPALVEAATHNWQGRAPPRH